MHSKRMAKEISLNKNKIIKKEFSNIRNKKEGLKNMGIYNTFYSPVEFSKLYLMIKTKTLTLHQTFHQAGYTDGK